MALSWNEIKQRAVNFSKEWADTINEDAEAKPFLVAFFEVFGISRKKIATFEERVKKLDESDGYIDLLWKGTLLVEMKSRGKNLDKAYQQAKDYLHHVKQVELPKYIIVSDFENFRLYDLEEETRVDFQLKDFVHYVQHFGFIAGYQKKTYKEQDPVNIRAAELMGKLHDQMEAAGYEGHALEVYLVRLLFCLFADDTTIFEKDTFRDFIEEKTAEDGSDLAARLNELFYILNTPDDKRLKNLDEHLRAFPYVNGKLFEENLPPAAFTSEMRRSLLECCTLNWGKISPAIFGSMFQSVMNPKERRNLGAHYTSEKNILKLIKPLFLDDLWAEFEKVKNNSSQLRKFHEKISQFRFLDPACGCGNFLVISYRELRLLELEIIKQLQKGQQVFNVSDLIRLNVDRFYGIEIEEFPAQIAQVALWLMDHQMNMTVSEAFGEYFLRLPLRKSPVIVQGNALRMDWQSLIDPIPWENKEQKFDFIFGNPPFVGSKWMSIEQRSDVAPFLKIIDNYGILDYVAAWYVKSALLIQESETRVAFVSTNSITQGEQVGTLWNPLFKIFKIKIHFAHKTFNWKNEAGSNAAVHVVIIGFGCFDVNLKRIFEYDHSNSEPHELIVKNISPYLIEGPDFAITNRSNPLCNVPKLKTGNKPLDDGNYIFSEEEMQRFIKIEPESKIYFKKYIGSEEFINGTPRFILWLKDADLNKLRNLTLISQRIENVIKFRKSSKSLPTKKLADQPTRFHTENYPLSDFLVIPQVSSERRSYIPIAFEHPGIICSDKLRILEDATLYHFGILISKMHMSWMRVVTGRLKSDYQYSVLTVYNNFPWPENPTEKQRNDVEIAAKGVTQVRKEFSKYSLADLYDPISMPPQLLKAHQALDKAVDLCYRPQPFTSEAKRMEFLFELYEKYTAGLFAEEKKRRSKAKTRRVKEAE